ncbi:MAG: phosphate acetyltransferase [Bacillota bacterium]
MGFEAEIKAQAKSEDKTIVLSEGTERRTIKAAPRIVNEELANVILLGDKSQIDQLAQEEGVDISAVEVINPAEFDNLDDFGNTYYKLRKHKGISESEAVEKVQTPLNFGAMLVKKGLADGLVAGAENATANVLRAVIKILGTADDVSIISGSFLMVIPDCEYGAEGKILFADSGVNPEGSAEDLAEIAIASAENFASLTGEEPKVAMLSFSTKGSAQHPSAEKMEQAAKICQQKAPDLKVDGELQADAALVPEIADRKAPGSNLGGEANVLIFPDLNSGNISYKLVQRLANANAYGPLIQGAALPANDLSRGCSVEDIVMVSAITAVQSIYKDN